MAQLIPPSTPTFQTAVYNAFVKIVNQLVEDGRINFEEGKQLMQQIGVGKNDENLDITVKKNVYQVSNNFQDLLNEIGLDYLKILDMITIEEQKIKEENLDEEEKRKQGPYAHLQNATRRIFGYKDKLELANKFWEVQPFFYDESKLWWLWDLNNRMWNIVDEVDLFNALDRALESDLSLRSRHKAEIIEALKRVGRGRKPNPIKNSMIQFKDQIYDLETDEVITATPDLFATNPIPHEIGESDETPTLDKIFTEWVGSEYIQTLYDILAYCMIPDYPLHRIFCLVGSGMNGKGRFLELISRFIGDQNKTSTELDYLMNSRFEAAKLYKKLVCLMGETNFTELSKTSLLKRLSGGDTIGYEFKNKDPFDDYNYAKILIATNSLPVTTDKTRGFYRRWLLIDFPNEFSEKRDILGEIPDVEYRNLAKKCITLLKRILKDREFSNEGSIEDRMRRYEERSNPVAQFIKEKCMVDPTLEQPFFKFYDEMIVYLKQRGHRHLSKREVGRILRNDGFELDKKHVRVPDPDKNGGQKDTKWLYIFGLIVKEKGNLGHYEKESGPKGPKGPHIPLQTPIRDFNRNTGPTGPTGPVNSENPSPGADIHLPCHYCGDEPTHTYDDKGRPTCNNCFKNLSINGIKVEEETIKDTD
jgi:P4 family phage/plasmid primase-like protien